jgi:dTDP-4-amino-4,6-dideoxygalactose transaminase
LYVCKRLDIGWRDIGWALARCLGPDLGDGRGGGGVDAGADGPARRVEAWFAPPGSGRGALACLSVRTGLDLTLGALALPPGSEILMSALTIPDMAAIVEAHDLVPVPVDIDPRTLAPPPGAFARLATAKTRAIVLAHLFGARIPLDPYAAICREHRWLLIEDAAQAFTGAADSGRADSEDGADVSLYSFGPIKTASALGGGVVTVRDGDLLRRMRAAERALPAQSARELAARLLKYASFKAVCAPRIYGAFAAICRRLGVDRDRLVHAAVRGFAGRSLLDQIRRRPARALMSLLARRLDHAAALAPRIARRAALGRRLAAALGDGFDLPAAAVPAHSFWVFALVAPDADAVAAALRAAGFDATRVSSLAALGAPPGRETHPPTEARRLLERVVFLPLYPELDEAAVDRMAAVLRQHRHAVGRPPPLFAPAANV